uniref:Uncharacterized protein n=1 Tax=Oryza barthii TaxID=65489 RepID=A0A0D3HG48_9ORYZ
MVSIRKQPNTLERMDILLNGYCRQEDNGCSCPRLLLPGIRRNRLRPCRAVLSQVACASGVVLPAVPRQHLLVHLLIVVHSLAFPWTTVPKPNRVPRSTSLIHRVSIKWS